MAADVAPSWVHDHFPPGFDGPDEHHPMLSPTFLAALGRRLGAPSAGVDLLFAASGTACGVTGRFVEIDDHPLAWSDHRADVRTYRYHGQEGATISVGRGSAGRWDVWVDPTGHSPCRPGRTRELLDAIKVLVPPRSPVFTTVPACSAAALALIVGIGFRPLGAEVLFPAPDDTDDEEV